MGEAARDYKHKMEIADPQSPTVSGTNKCPGIISYLKQGYIVTAPFDFTIKTTKDDDRHFEARLPETLKGEGYIHWHTHDQLAKYVPFREDTLKTIIKINTEWRVETSDDIVLYQLPIAYPDHNIFTAVHGYFDASKYQELNIQLLWHKLDDTILIKAGTPLCHIIPVKRDMEIDLIVDKMNDQDRYNVAAYDYLTSHNFNKNIKDWADSTMKLFKKS